jgi:hypothetical protein
MQVEKQDLDKTKRDPHFKFIFHVAPETMEAEQEGVAMPESLRFGILEKDLRRAGTGRPEEGTRVSFEGVATGVRPVLVGLKKFEILPTSH